MKNNKKQGPMMGPRMMSGEKAKDFKGTLKKLIKYLSSYKIQILLVLIFAVASTIFAIVGPKILGKATTEIFEGIMGKISGASSGPDFSKIATILFWLIGLYLVSALFSFIQGYIMTKVSNKLTYKLRTDLNNKIHSLPFSYYDSTTNGEVLSKITNDVDTINQSFNQSITQLITSITTIIGILVMMFSISTPMTLISLCTLFISFIVIGFIAKKSQKHFKNQQKYLGKVNSIVEEDFSSHMIIQAYNGQEKSQKRFKNENEKLYKAAWKANFLSGLMMPIMNIISNIGYVIISIFGGYFAVKGKISIGDIQAFIQYNRQFSQPIAQLSQISNVIQQTIAASERVFEFLEGKELIKDSKNAISVTKDKKEKNKLLIKGNVEFKNVNFGYIKDKTIINDFSCNIKEGEKIAIVGPTGAGKSTIVKLLMRFYDATSGSIKLDNHDIKDIKRDDLRSIIGMVLQDTWLFNGSIKENIKYGNLKATDKEVEKASKAACVDHFVLALPNGYDMLLNEEANNISEGQKQLLTIARTILADPKILILDEATSSVDTRTEELIQKAMDNLMKNRTSFIIAHRLSTIVNADKILVMDKGDIIEVGNHEELMNKKGFYYNLYNSQFEKVS